jgi:hypothetical protein
VLRSKPGYTVLTRAWWKPLLEPQRAAYQFDILIVADLAEARVDGSKTWLVRTVPETVIDVIRSGDYEQEFYDKPSDLYETTIREYCVLDPTRTHMRPSLEAYRRTNGVFRRVRTSADELFFSECGFVLDVRTPEITVNPCGRATIEEKLFQLRRKLSQAEQRRDEGEADVAGLKNAIAGLEERLASRQADDDV